MIDVHKLNLVLSRRRRFCAVGRMGNLIKYYISLDSIIAQFFQTPISQDQREEEAAEIQARTSSVCINAQEDNHCKFTGVV